MRRLQCHVVQQEGAEIGAEGVVAAPGQVEPDHPQSPGRVMALALVTHPPRLSRQVRDGDHQPRPQLGVNGYQALWWRPFLWAELAALRAAWRGTRSDASEQPDESGS